VSECFFFFFPRQHNVQTYQASVNNPQDPLSVDIVKRWVVKNVYLPPLTHPLFS